MPDRVNNPPLRKLSFIEEFVLQRVRVLSSAINITLNRPKGQYNVFHGHCICFEDNAAAICGNQLPDINFIDNSIKITIEGPAKAVNSIHLEKKLRNLKCISISATSVLDWLYFLKFMNPYYYDIVIKNPNAGDKNRTGAPTCKVLSEVYTNRLTDNQSQLWVVEGRGFTKQKQPYQFQNDPSRCVV